MAPRVVFTAGLLALVAAGSCVAQTLNVGSKRFTESYILGEIIKQAGESAGEVKAEHRQGLGNTSIVLNALTTGAIDVYPEYTGTIAKEILKLDQVPPLAELNAKLAPMGLAAGVPLGFNNTYALALRGDDARTRKLTTLSGLKAHPDLKLGLTQEFLGRADGWPGLKRAYELPFETPRGLDHGIAYEAIEGRQVDVIDIYSTDAKLDKLGLVVLADDRSYFPRYDAVLLYRADLPTRWPKTWDALKKLEGRIDDARMRRMNAAAELEMGRDRGRNEARAGREDVAVSGCRLLAHVEPLRHEQREVVLRARHRHIQQPAFLLDLGGAPGRHVRRDAAVDDVQHLHRLPFLALRRVDRGQDQIVLVEQRRA